MRLLYVSHPVTSPNPVRQAANLAAAERWGQRLLEMGYMVYGPWSILEPPPHMDREAAWHYAMAQCLPLVDMCEAIFMCPGWEESRGCRVELDRAMDGDKPVLTTAEHLQAFVGVAA